MTYTIFMNLTKKISVLILNNCFKNTDSSNKILPKVAVQCLKTLFSFMQQPFPKIAR